MLILQLLPAVLSLLVLGAHFYRAGDLLLVAPLPILLALLFVRRSWAARIVQGALVLGTFEWVRTLVILANYRAGVGLPYVRLVAILGVVALVCLLSALAFRSARARRWYRIGAHSGDGISVETPQVGA
ncbi:MAG: hypothetical protein R3E97_04560 [Candidatus Eisenbacteria bacterium]